MTPAAIVETSETETTEPTLADALDAVEHLRSTVRTLAAQLRDAQVA